MPSDIILNAANSQIATLTTQVNNLLADNALLQSNLNAANSQIASLMTQVNNLLAANAVLQSNLNVANSQIASLQNEVTELQEELDQLKAPAERVSFVLETIQNILPTAPKGAQGNLDAALRMLDDVQICLASGDLDGAIQEIASVLEKLVKADDLGVDTAMLQRALVEGVAIRVNKAVADVEVIVGVTSIKIQQANSLVQAGQALLQSDYYADALATFYKALQKASSAK